jgi:hypothetical protein
METINVHNITPADFVVENLNEKHWVVVVFGTECSKA